MKAKNFIRSISLLFFIFFNFSAFACNYTITLWDAWGDGWNGGTVTVYVNGTPVLSDLTFIDGYGPINYSFVVSSGDLITTTVFAGSYPEEMYYYVYNSSGTEVFMDGCTDYSCDAVGGIVGIGFCPDIDLELLSWDSPDIGCNLTSAEVVSCTVWNGGALAQSSYDLAYSIDGGTTWVTQSFTQAIGPGQSLPFSFTQTADFSTLGSYNCLVSVTCPNDQNLPNNQLSHILNHTPVNTIYPYVQNFDAGSGDWASGGVNSSWAHGTPAGSTINYAYSGTGSWATNLTGYYNASEQSYVESPCFDFTSLTNPYVDFYWWMYTYEYYDGAAFQYTTDGTTWQTVGNTFYPPDPVGWYNEDYIQGLFYTGNTIGWSSTENGWINTQHPLTGLGGEPFVKFRFVFGSDATYNNYDGFAFDNFTIFQPPDMTWSTTTIAQWSQFDNSNHGFVTTPGSQDVGVLLCQIETNSSTNPLLCTDFYFNTTGSSNSPDIVLARMYNTGPSPVFNMQNQFGQDALPNSPFSFTDSLLLAEGMNYFWLVYNVASSALIGNVLDAVVDSFKLSGTNYIPASPDPTGNVLIMSPLSGTYTIDPLGSGPTNYLSFSAAVEDLNTLGISGPVTFQVAPGTYNEQVSISNYPGSDPTRPVVFQSSLNDNTSVELTFPPTLYNANYTVQLNGAQNVTFQHLTLSTTGTTYSRVVETMNMAINNQFLNNRFIGPTTTTTSNYRALFYSIWTNDNDNIISNNYFYGGSFGLCLYGDWSSTPEEGYVIHNNQFIDQYYCGIYIESQDAPVITDNIIHSTSIYTAYRGIYLYYCYNEIRVLGNHITKFINGGRGIYFYYTGGTLNKSTNNVWIGNNFISINSIGTSGAGGIEIYNGYNIDVFYNSVNILGDNILSRAFYLNNSNTGITCLNNLFVNQSMGYAVNIDPTAILSSDYNDLYTNGDNLAWFGNNISDLSGWQLAAVQDTNSLSTLPVFVNDSNLHTFSLGLYQVGIPVPEILDDIDGDLRSLTAPCMGADEFMPPANDVWLMAVNHPNTGCGLSVESIELLIRNVGLNSITSLTAYYEVDQSGVPVSEAISATILPGDSLYFTFSTTYDFSFNTQDTTFTLDAWVILTGDINNLNDSVIEVITSKYTPPDPIVSDITINGGEMASLVAISNDTISWYDNEFDTQPSFFGMPYSVGPLFETTTYWAQVNSISSLVITEVGLGSDFVEIQNVGQSVTDATGWVVAVSSSYTSINNTNSIYWNLGILNPGEVQYKTDSSNDNYWGNNIYFSAGSKGWVVIIDNLGDIVDFATWGWTLAELQGWNPTINGFSMSVSDSWVSNGISPYNLSYLLRNTVDNNIAADWTNTSISGKGSPNPNMVIQGIQSSCSSNIAPLQVNVIGQPDIQVQDTCLEFAPIMQWTSSSLSFFIGNTGNYVINIDSLYNSLPEFSHTVISSSVYPGDSSEVIVDFSPTTLGIFTDTIWIVSNDVDTFVCLTGEATPPPGFGINPDSVYVQLNCSDTAIIPVNILNSGLGVLEYEIEIGENGSYSNTEIYTATGISTFHTFTGLLNYADSLYITITINGDYNGTSEYIDVYIDGDFIGLFQGGFTYTDLSVTYVVTGSQLIGWLSDGEIFVEIDNSSGVNTGYGTNINRVELEFVSPGWVSVANLTGVVNPLSSGIAYFEIVSTGLSTGIYNALINISSNDPLIPYLSLIIYLEVAGLPEIEFDVLCLEFDSIMEWTDATESFFIRNIGCDTLIIDTIINSLSVFTYQLTNFILLPGDSVLFPAEFIPSTTGPFYDTLVFYGNIQDTNVCLYGFGLGSPVINAIPDSIGITISACCDSVIVPVTISNTGVVDLTFEVDGVSNIGSNANSLTKILDNLNLNYNSVTSVIPGMYSFTDGITGTNISDGGGDMYDGGNYLSTNFGTNIPYSDNLVINSTAFGNSDQNYFTRKYDGLFVLAADLFGVSDFMITGNLGADGSGNVDGSVLTITHNGITYLGFVSRVYNAYDPSINHLIIVEEDAFVNHTYLTNTSYEDHQIHNLNNTNRLYYLLYASVGGAYIDDNATLIIMENFLNAMDLAPSWLSTSVLSDTIPPSGTTVIDFELTSCSNSSGVYSANVLLNSNDPLNPNYIIPVTLTIDGIPEMVVIDTCLHFGTIMQWTTSTQTIDIENTGCDTLWIYDINNTLPEYSVNPSSLFVLPGETEQVAVLFSPVTNDIFIDTLNVLSNDGNLSLCLTGYSLGAPEILAVPDSFEFTLISCNDSLIVPLEITNVGLSDLVFDLNSAKQGQQAIYGTPQIVLVTPDNAAALDVRTQIVATGLFTLADIGIIAAPNPLTSAMLEPYDAALVWTSNSFIDGIAVGDTLKKYVDNGGGVVLATYAYNSAYWGLQGGIFDADYSPFTLSAGANVSGVININTVLDPYHPVFDNINANLAYWTNTNYSNTPLNTGGILLAQDTWGNNVIGINGAGNVIGINIYPPHLASGNTETRLLFANALNTVSSIVNWISFSVDTDTLGILGNSVVDVIFNTVGLTNGQYIANIVIDSNDPLTPQILVPCTLNINSNPIIDITPDCFAFDSTMQWTTITDTFVVYNNGCDTLVVSNITNVLPEYTVDKTSFSILPDEFEVVTISFSPASIGVFNDTLTLFTNDHDTTICLAGNGYGAPIISTTPGQFDFVLNLCDEVASQQLTIFNTGTEDLIWDFSGGYGVSLDSTSIQYYNSSGVTTVHNFIGSYANTDSMTVIVTINGDYDSSGEFASLSIEGQSLGQITDYDVPNGNDIVVTYNLGGTDVINWLQDGLVQISVVNSSGVDHWSGLVSIHQVQLVINGIEWMLLSQSNGIVPPGDSTTIDVFAEADGLISGIYNANISIASNDPLNPLLQIPVSLTLFGYPVIELSDQCITIDSVMAGLTESEIITLYNTGCDTLFITSMSNQLTEFTINLSSFFIPPGLSQDIIVSFTSGGISAYYDTLIIYNNDVDTSICLLGTGIGVPVLDVYPDPIIINVSGCDVSIFSIYIGNDGNEDLDWSASDISASLIYDDFDPAIDLTQWSSISGATAYNSCGVQSGINALYFNSSGLRSAMTYDLEMLGGGIIDFYLKIGSGSFPCENADGGEDVALQYSIDGGITWININVYDTEIFTSWTYIQEDIPVSAQTISTRFRWYQVSHSGNGYDNWSIDDVQISGSSFGMGLSVNSGTVLQNDSTEVAITIDAAGLNAGTYTANLFISSNDPYSSNVSIPVILNINMTPLVVNAGLDDTLSLGSSMTLLGSVTGGNTPYIYSWAPPDDLNNPYLANPTADPVLPVLYILSVEDATGCVGSDDVYIHIMHSISGILTYDNSNSEPLAGAWSILKNSNGIKIDSALTDTYGNYLFEGVENGSYSLDANILSTWGGGNATDALKIRRHVVVIEPLTALPMAAADVNASNSVTSFDALYVLRRTVGYISSFPAGDWVADKPVVSISNNNAVVNYSALCFGDVNGSHIVSPAKSKQPTITIHKEGELLVSNNDYIDLPVFVENVENIGAITLFLSYPVNVLEFDKIIDGPEEMIYLDHFGQLNIAWDNIIPIIPTNNTEIFKLRFFVKEDILTADIEIVADSEFADENGNVLQDVKLIIPEIVDGFTVNDFFISENHPNPFKDFTTIEYYIPEDGQVLLEVKDLLGRHVETLVNSHQTRGKYNMKFDGAGLSNGAYVYKITYIKGPDKITKSQIMHLIRY